MSIAAGDLYEVSQSERGRENYEGSHWRDARAALMLEDAYQDGEVLAFVILRAEDLDGRQTLKDYSGMAVSDRMLAAGLEALREQSRPGCECVSHDHDDKCEEVTA
jgi:hypothetical protein